MLTEFTDKCHGIKICERKLLGSIGFGAFIIGCFKGLSMGILLTLGGYSAALMGITTLDKFANGGNL